MEETEECLSGYSRETIRNLYIYLCKKPISQNLDPVARITAGEGIRARYIDYELGLFNYENNNPFGENHDEIRINSLVHVSFCNPCKRRYTEIAVEQAKKFAMPFWVICENEFDNRNVAKTMLELSNPLKLDIPLELILS